jgi:hypothetical protein
MHNTQKIIVIASGVAAAFAIKAHRDATREQKRLARIRNIMREIDATFAASDIVNKRALNGEYRGKSKDDIMNDFKFEQIAYLEK